MMWKIFLVLAGALCRGQSQLFGNGSCSIATSHLDRALASLLQNLPAEFEFTDGREVTIYPGLSLGRTYLRGLKEMEIMKPYLIYCDPSANNAKARVNVEFNVLQGMEIYAPLKFCGSEAVLRTRLLDGRFIVVFAVHENENSSVVMLPMELRPVWMEKFMARLEGLGPAVSTASSVIGVLFSQVARQYWSVALEKYGPIALREVAQQTV